MPSIQIDPLVDGDVVMHSHDALDVALDDRYVAVTGDTMIGQLFIDGSADAIQLKVQGHSSQTANLTEWQNSSGTVLSCVDKSGNVGIGTTNPGQMLDVNGNILVAAGGTIDTRAAGTLTIGGTTQTGLTVGRTGATTSLKGSNFTAGGIGYGASNTLTFTSAGTSGQALLSGGAGAPTFGTLGLTYGGTNANLSSVATGGLIYKGASALTSTGALTGVLKGNGSSAPSAMTGTPSYVTRWTDANTLGTGVLYDNGTNVGVGTTSPTERLQVAGNILTSGTVATTYGDSFGQGTQLLASNLYVQSRGMNLVTNGSGLLQNNYNFSSFTFDQSDTHGGKGSFQRSGDTVSSGTDELIPIDGTRTYRLSLWAKSTTYVAGNHSYFGVTPYDIDGNIVSPIYYMRQSGTDTTLAQTINPGDTQIVLTSGSNWENTSTLTYRRQIIFWNYTNSFGFTYPAYTYSRNTSINYGNYNSNGAWSVGGISGNTITLTEPWPASLGSIPAGTAVSNGTSGGYKYIAASNAEIPNEWTNYTGKIGGWDTAGANVTSQFPYGTAYVKLLFLLNRNVTGNVTNLSDLWFSEVAADNIEIASATQQGVVSLGNQQLGTGDKYFGGNVGIGTTSTSYKLDVSGGTGIVGRFSGRVIGGNAVNSNEFVTLSQLTGGTGQYWTRTGTNLSPTTSGDDVYLPSGSVLGVGYDPTAISSGVAAFNGNVGIGTTSPTSTLALGGNSARVFQLERHTTANSAGNTLTITAGGATSGATDKNGGNLYLQGGLATGTGESGVVLFGCVAGATGTTDRTQTAMVRVLGNKIGFFTSTPVIKATALTAVDSNALNTGDATSDAVIANMRTRINELESRLQSYGLLS